MMIAFLAVFVAQQVVSPEMDLRKACFSTVPIEGIDPAYSPKCREILGSASKAPLEPPDRNLLAVAWAEHDRRWRAYVDCLSQEATQLSSQKETAADIATVAFALCQDERFWATKAKADLANVDGTSGIESAEVTMVRADAELRTMVMAIVMTRRVRD